MIRPPPKAWLCLGFRIPDPAGVLSGGSSIIDFLLHASYRQAYHELSHYSPYLTAFVYIVDRSPQILSSSPYSFKFFKSFKFSCMTDLLFTKAWLIQLHLPEKGNTRERNREHGVQAEASQWDGPCSSNNNFLYFVIGLLRVF